ncbi:hypothetical protein BDV26DRAFT_289301 [Aspergillus bertholletiae]|uniref:Uncharacterized protein n=1 Tax=Aspergillus bertholletiae TaxID=1226010 RepID=A0A5N7BIP7_9EURO|nr:hypothetical protein BDV26DRAFT_289301 [Aspergillus bertholletiae]
MPEISPTSEPLYPTFIYEETPDGWRFFRVLADCPVDVAVSEWQEDGDVAGVCPPGYSLAFIPPCPFHYIDVEEPSKMTLSGDPSGENPKTTTVANTPTSVQLETSSPLAPSELSISDFPKRYSPAGDATYVIMFLVTVTLLSLAARSYMRRSKVSQEHAKMSLPVTNCAKGLPSELPAI